MIKKKKVFVLEWLCSILRPLQHGCNCLRHLVRGRDLGEDCSAPAPFAERGSAPAPSDVRGESWSNVALPSSQYLQLHASSRFLLVFHPQNPSGGTGPPQVFAELHRIKI